MWGDRALGTRERGCMYCEWGSRYAQATLYLRLENRNRYAQATMISVSARFEDVISVSARFEDVRGDRKLLVRQDWQCTKGWVVDGVS